MGVRNSYVWGLDFLRLGVSFLISYVWGFLRLGDFLRLGVRNSYVWGLGVRLGVSFLTFGGWEFSYVWGLGILRFGG